MSVEETVAGRVAAMAARQGPLPYPEVIDQALYGDLGFYATVGAAGRRRDFLTSPETGHLFGAVVARMLDGWWQQLGRPDPFWMIEAGAGTGTLCRTVLDAHPDCAPALRYLCVERSAAQREQIGARVPVEPPTQIMGAVALSDDDDDAVPRPGQGPLVAAVADLPDQVGPGVVFANELLDNLPPVVLERSRDGWLEVRIDAHLAEVTVPADPALVRTADRLAPAARAGQRIPVARAARQWLGRARAAVTEGAVIAVDYGASTATLAERGWDGWARTYRDHRRGGRPLEQLGTVDVTFDVPTDQLDPDEDCSQAEWLARWGMEELVEEARREWDARTGWNLAALKARSRVGEGVTLRDPDGFGAFRVLEWHLPAPR